MVCTTKWKKKNSLSGNSVNGIITDTKNKNSTQFNIINQYDPIGFFNSCPTHPSCLFLKEQELCIF